MNLRPFMKTAAVASAAGLLATVATLSLSTTAPAPLQADVPTSLLAMPTAPATTKASGRAMSTLRAMATSTATMASAEQAAVRAGAQVKHLRRTGSGSHVMKLDKQLRLDRLHQLHRTRVLVLILGLLGYYGASILDFLGLQYISAGLERLILFLQPTIVVLLSAFFFKTKIRRHHVISIALSCRLAYSSSRWCARPAG